jgi:hypothetical protein
MGAVRLLSIVHVVGPNLLRATIKKNRADYWAAT